MVAIVPSRGRRRKKKKKKKKHTDLHRVAALQIGKAETVARPTSMPVQQPQSPTPLAPQPSGTGARIPTLTPEKATEFAALFRSEAQNGVLDG